MRPLALLLEDDPDIRQERAESLHRMGLAVLTAGTVSEARRHLYASPSLDLLICDINLDASNPEDKSGYQFAEDTRRRFAKVTIVGYSGHFEATRFKKTPRARSTFNDVFARGRNEEFDKYIDGLVSIISARFAKGDGEERAFERLVELIGKSFLSEPETIGALRSFKSYFTNTGDSEVNFTDDYVLAMSGYRLIVVSAPAMQNTSSTSNDVRLAAPLPVWCRHEENTWKMEVFAHHQFATVANTREGGLSSLLAQMSAAARGSIEAAVDAEHRLFASRILVQPA